MRLLLYAPNVNGGGGLVLLQALLSDPQLPAGPMFLDARAAGRLVLPEGSDVRWVRPSVSDRFGAERALANTAHAEDLVVCFHGLPPIFRVTGAINRAKFSGITSVIVAPKSAHHSARG